MLPSNEHLQNSGTDRINKGNLTHRSRNLVNPRFLPKAKNSPMTYFNKRFVSKISKEKEINS